MYKRSLIAALGLFFAAGFAAAQDRPGSQAPIYSGPNAKICFEPTVNAGADACLQRTGPGVIQLTNGIANTGSSLGGTFPWVVPNVKADGKTYGDCSITNGQAVLTCASGAFAATDVGKIAWVTNVTNDISALTSVLVTPQTTVLSFQSPTQITLASNATVAGCVSNCVVMVGSDDSAGLAAAWTSAIGVCGTVKLPQGFILVQSGQFNTNSAGDKCLPDRTGGYGGYGVQGMGQGNSTLVPTPNFDPNTCNGTTSLDACFFGATMVTVADLGIWGTGVANMGAGFNGKAAIHLTGTDAVSLGGNSYASNIIELSWGAQNAGFTGFSVTGESDPVLVNVHNDGIGARGCSFQTPFGNAAITLINVFCAVNAGPSLYFTGGTGSVLYSYGGIYGYILSANKAVVEIDGGGTGAPIFESFGDNAPYSTSTTNGNELYCHGNAVCNLHGSNFANPSSGSATGISISVGSTVNLQHTTVSCLSCGNNGGAILLGGATARAVSQGGNTIAGNGTAKAVDRAQFGGTFFSNPTDIYSGLLTDMLPTCAMTTGGGTSPACATVAGSTNEKGTVRMTPGTTPAALGTTTLTFAGTFSGATATTPACNFTLANTGTGTWNARATPILLTRSTTAPVFNWDNNAVALTAASTYDVDYACTQR